MTRVAQELRAMLAALIYFTRLPLPALSHSSPDDWRRAATYFPLAGWLVGGAAAGVWLAASRIFPPGIAAGLCLAATLLLTGAMHEDGLADVCDGLGGGPTREKALEIMRDSRIGAFGAIGLVVLLGLKWQAMAALPAAIAPAAFIVAHTLSRSAAISLLASLDYARSEGKARPLVSRLRWPRLAVTTVLGLLPLALLPIAFWWVIVPALAIRGLAAAWFRHRLGGYTGDCLGATQQLGEAACLLTFVALSRP